MVLEKRTYVELSSIPPDLGSILNSLKNACSECGAIAVYVGIVKPFSKDGAPVKEMIFSARHDSRELLESIANSVIKRCGCVAMYVWHRVGVAKVGEEIAIIAACGISRDEAISCIKLVIDEVKRVEPVARIEVKALDKEIR